MKDHFFYVPNLLSLPTLLLTALLLTNVGCPDRSKKDIDPIIGAVAPSQPSALAAAPVTVVAAPPVSPAVFTDMSAALDNITRDTTSSLPGLQANLSRSINDQIAAWKATGGTNTVMMEEKLSLAREDFTQKVNALSFATEETWSSVKDGARVSLQNLQRVYADYLAGPPKI